MILGWFFHVALKPLSLSRRVAYALCSLLYFIFIRYGWLERGTHLFARVAHSMSRSGRLPIHTPGRYWVRVSSGVPTTRNDSRRNLRLFILSHTQKKDERIVWARAAPGTHKSEPPNDGSNCDACTKRPRPPPNMNN